MSKPAPEVQAIGSVVAFCIVLCTDPDGLPDTAAGLQRSLEIWLEECHQFDRLAFEELYAWIFGALELNDIAAQRARLRPLAERKASIQP